MKTIKVAEATGVALDWLVAKCEGKVEQGMYGTPEFRDGAVYLHYCDATLSGCYSPATNWAQGGPIIERMLEAGLLLQARPETLRWAASVDSPNHFVHGPTALIAAMRCYVASKLGDEVEVPDEPIKENQS